MATPRRRSSRNRQTPSDHATTTIKAPAKLATVDESEHDTNSTNDKDLGMTAAPQGQSPADQAKTPTRSAAPKPSTEEMHPSLFQSNAKKLASEMNFGFGVTSTTSTPTKQIGVPSVAQSVPPKPAANPFASPSFEFRFKRPSSELSSEAQRMMDQVREQAALIKTQLSAQRDEQNRKEGEADALFGTRKFATPKRKLGRFSDAHNESFKKMDSIANHPSAYRADSSRPTSAQKSLKRTNSRAELDKIDSAPQTPSKSSRTTPGDNHDSQGPAKRLKSSSKASHPVLKGGDISPSRLAASNGGALQSQTLETPTKSTKSPTKAVAGGGTSAARKALPGSSIPRTPSQKLSTASRTLSSAPQTDPSNKRRSLLSGKLSAVRSILRKPQRRFSNDPVKQAAGTHMAVPGPKQDACTPPKGSAGSAVAGHVPSTPSNQSGKHVNFSPVPQIFGGSISSKAPKSPSPLKAQVSYPAISASTLTAPTISSSKRGSAVAPAPGNPKDFTFRAGSTISFGGPPQQPATPNPQKTADREKAIMSDPPSGSLQDLPNVPHGLSNKKRKRDSKEDEAEDKENRDTEEKTTQQSPSKRARIATPSKVKMPPSLRVPDGSPKKKSVLSMSRLNQLAAPKHRR